MAINFRVELVWTDETGEQATSIFLTKDGRVVLQGSAVSQAEREQLNLPRDAALISVDHSVIRAIKEML